MGLMIDAYGAAGRAYRERLSERKPLEARRLAELEASDVLVVRGCYDHAENVLGGMGLPCTAIEPENLGQLKLRPSQTVLINCPGNLDRAALAATRRFVRAGGCLVTTDWALPNVIEKAFPGYVEFNKRPTRDDVVPVQITGAGSHFIDDLLDKDDDPQWWLEGASHPIRVLDPARVEVLISSREMEARYGEAPIAVRFRPGKGVVYHIVSHYYLQRTETRTARQKGDAKEYLAAKGGLFAAENCAADQYVGEVEAALASAGFLGKILAKRGDGEGGSEP